MASKPLANSSTGSPSRPTGPPWEATGDRERAVPVLSLGLLLPGVRGAGIGVPGAGADGVLGAVTLGNGVAGIAADGLGVAGAVIGSAVLSSANRCSGPWTIASGKKARTRCAATSISSAGRILRAFTRMGRFS